MIHDTQSRLERAVDTLVEFLVRRQPHTCVLYFWEYEWIGHCWFTTDIAVACCWFVKDSNESDLASNAKFEEARKLVKTYEAETSADTTPAAGAGEGEEEDTTAAATAAEEEEDEY